MSFLLILALILIPLVLVSLWLGQVRPYCLRHGKGYTPGATSGTTFWVDLQEAGEIARERKDQEMIRLCRLMTLLQVTAFLLPCGLLVASVVREQQKEEEELRQLELLQPQPPAGKSEQSPR